MKLVEFQLRFGAKVAKLIGIIAIGLSEYGTKFPVYLLGFYKIRLKRVKMRHWSCEERYTSTVTHSSYI